jgi:hypothetical protein
MAYPGVSAISFDVGLSLSLSTVHVLPGNRDGLTVVQSGAKEIG